MRKTFAVPAQKHSKHKSQVAPLGALLKNDRLSALRSPCESRQFWNTPSWRKMDLPGHLLTDLVEKLVFSFTHLATTLQRGNKTVLELHTHSSLRKTLFYKLIVFCCCSLFVFCCLFFKQTRQFVVVWPQRYFCENFCLHRHTEGTRPHGWSHTHLLASLPLLPHHSHTDVK